MQQTLVMETFPVVENRDRVSTPGFIEAFSRNLQADPEAAACHSVAVQGERLLAEAASFRTISRLAWRYRQQLEAHGVKRGDRVVLCVGHPHAFLASFLACSASGAVSVPLPAASDFGLPGAYIDRIRSVVKDCGPRLMIVENKRRWAKFPLGEEFAVPTVGTEEMSLEGDAEPAGWLDVDVSASDPIFLQYTSGSTGQPRGVVVTHGNLAANCHAIGTATDVAPDTDSMLSWLPLHHDMGLVGGLLFPVYWKMETRIMNPASFIMRPLNWLRAIQQFRASYSVAPNFAYATCLSKIPDRDLVGLDLSSWRLAFNGAEPIHRETAEGFIKRFAQHGFRPTSFYPVYGLAEATLALSFPAAGSRNVVDVVDRATLANHGMAVPAAASGEGGVSFVSVGRAVPGHEIRIVDPNSQAVCGERQVGEIVARGPSVSPRYFNDEGAAARTELKTGDLGYVADGNLFVIDRLKDLIIIAGQKFAPSDVENSLWDIDGVRKGRVVAFSSKGENGTEELHIVAEMDLRSMRRQTDIRDEVAQRVQKKFGVDVKEIRLCSPGTLPRTTSGKLQRKACQALYFAGSIPSGVSLGTRLALTARQMLMKVRMAGKRS